MEGLFLGPDGYCLVISTGAMAYNKWHRAVDKLWVKMRAECGQLYKW